MRVILWPLLALVVAAAFPIQGDGVTVTFLANEGVMLAGGGKKVIIDGLYVHYKGYALPPDSTQASLQAARAPFDAVDVILATHHHGDHFHPAPVIAHLRANARATLLTTNQAIDSMRGRLPAGNIPASRLLARTTPVGTWRREVVNGVTIHTLGTRHHEIDHLTYIVEIGGRRVLHVGDTDDAETAFTPFRLDTARIDVALVPSGMITNEKSRRAIQQWVRPKQLVGIHYPGKLDQDRARRELHEALPGAIAFVRHLETRRW
jgi:L-ascorbate metabolism protein UlaG (beta-lactamase superfamily)